MKNPVFKDSTHNKFVMIIRIVFVAFTILALLYAVVCDINGYRLLYGSGSASKIPKHIILCAVTLAAMFIPVVLTRKFGFRIPAAFQIQFTIIVFMHFILGNVFRLYDHPDILMPTKLFDKVEHAVCGVFLFMCGLTLAKHLSKSNNIFGLSPLVVVIFAFCFSLTVSCFWEFVEFIVDAISGSNMQRWQDGFTNVIIGGENKLVQFYGLSSGLIDTMADLLAAAIGALILIVPSCKMLKNKSDRIKSITISKYNIF